MNEARGSHVVQDPRFFAVEMACPYPAGIRRQHPRGIEVPIGGCQVTAFSQDFVKYHPAGARAKQRSPMTDWCVAVMRGFDPIEGGVVAPRLDARVGSRAPVKRTGGNG